MQKCVSFAPVSNLDTDDGNFNGWRLNLVKFKRLETETAPNGNKFLKKRGGSFWYVLKLSDKEGLREDDDFLR
jgi:hypothetical protein